MTRLTRLTTLTRLAGAVTLLSLTSGAAAQGSAGAGVVSALTACRAIAAPDARLACFDAAAARVAAAIESKEVTVVDRQDVQKARRSLFGFSLPRIPLFGLGGRDADRGEEKEFSELNTTIASARQIANGRVELRLTDEDAVWQTTDPLLFPPRAGTKMRIRKGALGNYFLAIQGERSVRGMRVR
ncbi:MAG TPA: hypothetical protein VM900_12225 [Sphingomonas sp.]|nr:hypothetical protein [Sphingomonas sp.]